MIYFNNHSDSTAGHGLTASKPLQVYQLIDSKLLQVYQLIDSKPLQVYQLIDSKKSNSRLIWFWFIYITKINWFKIIITVFILRNKSQYYSYDIRFHILFTNKKFTPFYDAFLLTFHMWTFEVLCVHVEQILESSCINDSLLYGEEYTDSL